MTGAQHGDRGEICNKEKLTQARFLLIAASATAVISDPLVQRPDISGPAVTAGSAREREEEDKKGEINVGEAWIQHGSEREY